MSTMIKTAAISPRHDATDTERLDRITSSMSDEGWTGRPVLVIRSDDSYRALTGSHRLAAAGIVGIESVPVVVATLDHDEAAYVMQSDDDESIEAALRELGEDEAAALMAVEIAHNIARS